MIMFSLRTFIYCSIVAVTGSSGYSTDMRLAANSDSSPTSSGYVVRVTEKSGLAVRATATTNTLLGVASASTTGTIVSGPVKVSGYYKCLVRWPGPKLTGWSALWSTGWRGISVVATPTPIPTTTPTPTPIPEPTATPIPCPTPIPIGVETIGARVNWRAMCLTTESLTQQGFAPIEAMPGYWGIAAVDDATATGTLDIVIRAGSKRPAINVRIEGK